MRVGWILLLALLLVVSVWQAMGSVRFTRLANVIRAAETESRIEAESLGSRVAEMESRLDRPEATADRRSGTRKTMIVALARKLLIALWRLATTGEVPRGVVLRAAV